MALQFDMSKGSWKQDYLMQLQGNEGISPYRQAGADLGTALGAVGSALLPERGKNIAANFNKMSSDFKKASSSRQSAIKAAIKKDREKGAGYFQGKQKPDLTALQGLGAMGGTALGVAGLAASKISIINK